MNISIKREQNNVCIGSAEREKFGAKLKTKNIFKTLVFAMLMPAMLLTVSCSSEDDLVNNTAENTEAVVNKGYALPVTVDVTRQGDEATTRAEYNETTKKLEFSEGDKLFVDGQYVGTAGKFAGTLDYDSESGKFSGTIYTENPYSGTADELFTAGGFRTEATLLPEGYEDYGYLKIGGEGYGAILTQVALNSFVTSKELAVEQLSIESGSYTSGTGFALNPLNAILNFTIIGLDASTNVTATLEDGESLKISGDVTTDAAGVATFVMGVYASRDLNDLSLTVGGTAITLVSESKTLSVGKIYNITRSATPVIDLSMLDCAGNLRASRWTANCYMVHKAGDYKLPLVYGNAIKNSADNVVAYYPGKDGSVTNGTDHFVNHNNGNITAPWITKSTSGEGVNKGMGITVTSAELLWQDANGLITKVGIDGDYLTLTVGKDDTTQEGNAVIAAKDRSGTVVWSWHIWVTKQTFASLTNINTGSHTYQVTPVNLGWVGDAVSKGYGTYYQWGRKDAFIPSTGTANTNHTVYDISGNEVTGITYSGILTTTIADNIKNPTTFYHVSNKPSTATYYNMWDAQNTAMDNVTTATKKTVYDPCPPGFCVPTGNLYYYAGEQQGVSSTTWDDTNKGRTWSGIFFPASGFRSSDSSLLGNVGSTGYYWSASASILQDNYGRYLKFESGSFKWDRNYRAIGCHVRAVAEE